MTRYVYKGQYREFRGYQFWNGKPVTITDRGTLEAIKREADFEVVDESPPVPEVLTLPERFACAKCGKAMRQGRFLHEKYCKG